MSVINTRLFEATEYKLVLYNNQAVINRAFRFYTVFECEGMPREEIPFDFPDYSSSYFRVFNERSGTLIKEFSMGQSDEYLILNQPSSDINFEDNGNYYYEIGYVRGVYEQALRYGTLSVI